MAVLFNSLVINMKSERFQPFLFNLVSGRRRLLNDFEFQLVSSMLMKECISDYNVHESAFFNELRTQKQFMTDEDRRLIERKLLEMGHFTDTGTFADDLSFSIEMTKACNMSCSYCYVGSQLRSGVHMTNDRVDAIYDFFNVYVDDNDRLKHVPNIRITGGEPLINLEVVKTINYIASKWPNSTLTLFTNGVNLLKYYDYLPLSAFDQVNISLDGLRDTHFERRYGGTDASPEIYDNIIAGIHRLINDRVHVRLVSALDRTNYQEYKKFKTFLLNEGIADSPYCTHIKGIIFDFENPLDIDERFNSKQDVIMIQKHLLDLNEINYQLFTGASFLSYALSRARNEPLIPQCQRCSGKFLSKCYFSCNGNVYFCDCVSEEKSSVIGTYYPHKQINKEVVSRLLNRCILNSEKCTGCIYKFICLGGCPISADIKGDEMTCSIFTDEEILDNIEYNYYWIPN